MLFSWAQIKTNEPSETIFKIIPEICKSINAKLTYIDETNYYIYAKLDEQELSLFEWSFHIQLNRNKKETTIDLFIEYEGVFKPGKKFIQILLDAIEKRITIKKIVNPDSWIYEIKKKENGSIKIDGNMVEKKWPRKKDTLESFVEVKYDVKPLGNYANKITKKIEKLFILIGEIHEMQLKKDGDSLPLFVIPYENIKKAEVIKYDKGLFHLPNSVLSISFHDINTSTSNANSIRDLYEQDLDHSLILDIKKENDITTIVGQIESVLETQDDRKKKLRQLASLQGMTLCTNCCIRPISFSFSLEQTCETCFTEKYGKIILSVRNGEYYGGHKIYLAGGMFSDYESGNMYLTDKYFIFNKIYNDVDNKKNWEIIIPFESIQIEQWGLQEGSRRKSFLGGGGVNDDSAFGGGFIVESGKRHRLIIPYFDENGIKHAPIFGVSSVKGDLIKLWAASLYQVVVKNIKNRSNEDNIPEANKVTMSDPVVILKMRFAKGEISKEEFEDMKKLLE